MTTLNLKMLPQPNGISCGATCLHAIYRYYGDEITLKKVITEAPSIDGGGTLVILLGIHALTRGYKVTLNSLNLNVIDPTWFNLEKSQLLEKLKKQLKRTRDPKVYLTTEAYIQFVKLGGTINFSAIHFDTIRTCIDEGIPLLCGMSATYLYQNMRDLTNDKNEVVYDEWAGAPSGHLVIIRGYDTKNELVHLADPYLPHPLSQNHYYSISFSHWLHAHLLGSMTYDSELLYFAPP